MNFLRNKIVYDSLITQPNEILSSKVIKLNANDLYKMSLTKDKTNLLIADTTNSVIHISDLLGNLFDSLNPDGILQQPTGICLNTYKNENEIFIGDQYEHKIFVFDSDFTFKRKFGDKNLKIPLFITCDEFSNSGILYISDLCNNSITLWDTESGQFIDTLSVDAAYIMKFTYEKLFVLSPNLFELDENVENKVTEITEGSNCIFVIDKVSLAITNRIELSNWLSPSALHIDPNFNMYVAAYEVNEENIKSECKYLFILSEHGDFIKKILLDNVKVFSDTIFLEKNIIIAFDNCLRLIKYE